MKAMDVVIIDESEKTPLSPLTPPTMENNNRQLNLSSKKSDDDMFAVPDLQYKNLIGNKNTPRTPTKSSDKNNEIENYISNLLSRESLYIDECLFFKNVQEVGKTQFDLDKNTIKRNKIYKDERTKMIFEDIYMLSVRLLDLYIEHSEEIFQGLKPTSKHINKSVKRKLLCKWIISNRVCIHQSNFTEISYPELHVHKHMVDCKATKVYILHQKLILRCAINQWAKNEFKAGK